MADPNGQQPPCGGECDELIQARQDLQQIAAWEREKVMHAAQKDLCDDRVGQVRCRQCGRPL